MEIGIDGFFTLYQKFAEQYEGDPDFYHFFMGMSVISARAMGMMSGSGEDRALDYAVGRLRAAYPGQTLTFFDCGSNVGDFVKLLFDRFGSDGFKVLCFEPSRKNFAALQDNLAVYGDAVEMFNFAVGEAPGTATLFGTGDSSTLCSLHAREIRPDLTLTPLEEISIRRIDDVCREQGIERVHFLKLDVEGHELFALKGATSLLAAGGVDFVQFEFGGTDIDSRTFLRDFWRILDGYAISRIMKRGLHTFEKYHESQECFFLQNFLAERRG